MPCQHSVRKTAIFVLVKAKIYMIFEIIIDLAAEAEDSMHLSRTGAPSLWQ